MILTVPLSIFAHGLSASPAIELYAGRLASLRPGALEHQAIKEKDAG